MFCKTCQFSVLEFFQKILKMDNFKTRCRIANERKGRLIHDECVIEHYSGKAPLRVHWKMFIVYADCFYGPFKKASKDQLGKLGRQINTCSNT